MKNLNVSDVLPVDDSRLLLSRKKTTVNSAVLSGEVSNKKLKYGVLTTIFAHFLQNRSWKSKLQANEIIRTEGESQGQRIGGAIIRPRDRATHGNKQMASERQSPNLDCAKMFMREKICWTAGRLAEDGIKSPSITNLYLVGTVDRWNDSKQAEELDRVKHI